MFLRELKAYRAKIAANEEQDWELLGELLSKLTSHFKPH
jgi:hypothetical protein